MVNREGETAGLAQEESKAVGQTRAGSFFSFFYEQKSAKHLLSLVLIVNN